jgi:predicted ATP-grasp superfamily ATP-dependent carboligase
MINENDSILVFEYFTASGEKEKNIISEAEELVFALLDDLSDFNVDLVINKSYEDIVKDFNNVNPIFDTKLDIVGKSKKNKLYNKKK